MFALTLPLYRAIFPLIFLSVDCLFAIQHNGFSLLWYSHFIRLLDTSLKLYCYNSSNPCGMFLHFIALSSICLFFFIVSVVCFVASLLCFHTYISAMSGLFLYYFLALFLLLLLRTRPNAFYCGGCCCCFRCDEMNCILLYSEDERKSARAQF